MIWMEGAKKPHGAILDELLDISTVTLFVTIYVGTATHTSARNAS
jgi:hypothetical protein